MKFLHFVFALMFAMPAMAKIQTEEITYKADVELTGFLAYDDTLEGKAPGILIVHEWWGHNQHSRDKAIEFAKAGFVAFALDMYGSGKVADHPDKAKEFMMQTLKQTETANARFERAKDILAANDRVNGKIGAVGYCFGGKVVLDQARMNQDLFGVVSIHGSLSSSDPDNKKRIKTPILVLHGEEDPMIDDKALVAFSREMTQRKADFGFISFAGATHAFTNPDATEKGKKFNLPLAYDEQADQMAHKQAKLFFQEKAK